MRSSPAARVVGRTVGCKYQDADLLCRHRPGCSLPRAPCALFTAVASLQGLLSANGQPSQSWCAMCAHGLPAVSASCSFPARSRRSLVRYAGWNGVVMMISASARCFSSSACMVMLFRTALELYPSSIPGRTPQTGVFAPAAGKRFTACDRDCDAKLWTTQEAVNSKAHLSRRPPWSP